MPRPVSFPLTNPSRSSVAMAARPVPAVPVRPSYPQSSPSPPSLTGILGLGHTCEAQIRGATMDQTETHAQAQARRPRASRSRAGCLSCKARKKKCDETRPRCSDCRRLNFPCRWRSRSSVSELDAQSPSQSVPTSDTPTVPSHEGWSAPSDHSASASPSESTSEFTSESTTCHGTFGQIEVAVTPVASPGAAIPYLENEEDRSLFNHYLHTVARALSRAANADSAGNPFLTTLVPMAAASDTLTSVLLGLSGCHWRRVYPGIWKRALARQGRGL